MTLILLSDNITATYVAANQVFHARTKHIEVDDNLVWDLFTSRHFQIKFVPSKYNFVTYLKRASIATFWHFFVQTRLLHHDFAGEYKEKMLSLSC